MAQQTTGDLVVWAIKNGDLDRVKELIEEKERSSMSMKRLPTKSKIHMILIILLL